ncbi:unnamed protein product [Polarella glacialis]|uniref:Mei2-like C-terminal RNA recognition motif domain-containing protein n=1 Tax=Polarella glacialis TaxID=89957 RepID=A0A813KND1_POLGL|nr:unnamed protein product [Polarella glacialis]
MSSECPGDAVPLLCHPSDVQAASSRPETVPVTLLSGAAVTVLDDAFVFGAGALDIRKRLGEIHPVGDEHEYRLLVGARILEDLEVVPPDSAEGVTAVVTTRPKTTIMVKSLTYEYNICDISEWLNEEGLLGLYDLIIVPIDLTTFDVSKGANPGFCFVNFVRESDAIRCFDLLSDVDFGSCRGPTEVSYAQVQGGSAYLHRCREKVAAGEPLELLGLRFGMAAFAVDGARVKLEDWMGLPHFSSADELIAQIADVDKPCRVRKTELLSFQRRIEQNNQALIAVSVIIIFIVVSCCCC